MNESPVILCDMDGVLFDFVSPVYRLFDREYDPNTYPAHERDLASIFGVKTYQLWRKIDSVGESFWSELKMYPWAKDLLSRLNELGTVIISTSPSFSAVSYSGKRLLLQKSGLGRIPCMIGRDKWLMSSPGRVLVDDYQSNGDAWSLMGGGFSLFPQPWNGGNPHHPDIVDHIVADVERLLNLGGDSYEG